MFKRLDVLMTTYEITEVLHSHSSTESTRSDSKYNIDINVKKQYEK